MLGIASPAAPNNAFGFDPNAMSAFSFNFAAGPTPTGPAGAGFAVNTSAFDLPPMAGGMMPMGGPGGAMAFQTMPMVGPAPSLFDVAHIPESSAAPTVSAAGPSKPDPFAGLSIEGIKKGFESPAPMLPSSTPSMITPSSSSSHVSTNAPAHSDFGDESAFMGSSSGANGDYDFADFPDASTPAPQPTPPPTQTKQETPVVSTPATPSPKPTPEPAQVHPKSADEFLSSIDLNGPPKKHIIEKPEPAKSTTTSYSNEGLIKTKIDWSKQRDLMASFLQPSKPAEESTPTAVPSTTSNTSEPAKSSASQTDDWGDFDNHTNGEAQDDDWSGFEATPSASATPSIAPSSSNTHLQTNDTQTSQNNTSPYASHLSTNQSAGHLDTHPAPQQNITPAAANWDASAILSTNSSSGFDTTAFDTSAFSNTSFDASAFNLSGSAFDAPLPEFPAPSISESHSAASIHSLEHSDASQAQSMPVQPQDIVPIATPVPIRPNPSETIPGFDTSGSSHATPLQEAETAITPQHRSHTPETLHQESLFSGQNTASSASNHEDFGSFTSTSHPDDDWSAFETDQANDSVDFDATGVPALNLPVAVSPAVKAQSLPKRQSQTKIWDISSFDLPTTPISTPLHSSRSSSVAASTEPIPYPTADSSSLIDDTPITTSGNHQSTTTSNDLFSLTSPSASAFDSFPAAEFPSWMNSNKSEDSTSSAPVSADAVDWKNQPTTEDLKKTLLSLLGTEKAAPFMWIFDNMSKSISISFEERHGLAAGLIEDLQSERVLWLSSSRVNQWHSLLSKCNEDILKASSYLSDVIVQADGESDEIISEFLIHPSTLSFLSATAKIYRVATRIIAAIQSNSGVHSTSQTPRTTCRYIKPSVLKAILALGNTVENSWTALNDQVSLMEEDSGSSGNPEDSPAMRALLVSKPVPHAPLDFNCYICYRGFDEHEGPTQWSEKTCHATCANYWVRRVANRPPPV